MAGRPGENALDLSDLGESLRGILWGCWRFRWPGIALAWAVCVVGWLVVLAIPDVYRASTRVYVDTKSTLRPLLQGLAVNSDVMNEVALMERTVMGREELEKLAIDTDMNLQAKDPAAFERLISQLQASIKFTRDREGVIQITYENSDPQKAFDVVSRLMTKFTARSIEESQKETSAAGKFLDDKLKEYAAKLNADETALANFKRKNVGMMPEEGADYYDRLQSEGAKLQEIDGKLRVARNRRAELQRQIEGEEPVFGLVPSDDKGAVGVSPQDRQIADFEQKLAELRLKYTDTHPDIVQIRKTLEELRAEKAAAAEKSGASRKAYSPLDLNPVYQQMKIQLSQVDVEIAQLQAEYAGQARVVGDLRNKVNTIPAIEAEMKSLTRNYNVTKTQYDELLRRVETARLSEAAEETKSGETFRKFDPPVLPTVPVGPNRSLLMTVVLGFALAAGFGLTLAMNLLQPVFYTGKDLERRFGVPVLGSIRLVRTPFETAMVRQKSRLVIASLAGLAVCYGLMLAFGSGPAPLGGGFLRGTLGL